MGGCPLLYSHLYVGPPYLLCYFCGCVLLSTAALHTLTSSGRRAKEVFTPHSLFRSISDSHSMKVPSESSNHFWFYVLCTFHVLFLLVRNLCTISHVQILFILFWCVKPPNWRRLDLLFPHFIIQNIFKHQNLFRFCLFILWFNIYVLHDFVWISNQSWGQPLIPGLSAQCWLSLGRYFLFVVTSNNMFFYISNFQLWICVRRWSMAVSISVSAPLTPTSVNVLTDSNWPTMGRAAKV